MSDPRILVAQLSRHGVQSNVPRDVNCGGVGDQTDLRLFATDNPELIGFPEEMLMGAGAHSYRVSQHSIAYAVSVLGFVSANCRSMEHGETAIHFASTVEFCLPGVLTPSRIAISSPVRM